MEGNLTDTVVAFTGRRPSFERSELKPCANYPLAVLDLGSFRRNGRQQTISCCFRLLAALLKGIYGLPSEGGVPDDEKEPRSPQSSSADWIGLSRNRCVRAAAPA